MKTVYRIITPILSIAIFPVLYFLPLLRVMISSGLSAGETKTNLLTTLTGLKDYISINDIVKLTSGDENKMSIYKQLWSNLADDTKQKILGDFSCGKFLIAAAVFLALFILLMLALMFISAISKNHLPSLCVSAGALISLFAANGCFKAFAKPFLSGAIGIGSIINGLATESSSSMNTLSALLGNLAKVDMLQLSIAYSACILITVAVIIFTLSAMIEEKYSK